MTINRQHRRFKEYRDREKRKWARDNQPCWLCGAALDYTNPGLPNSAEGDHVTAVAAGGHILGPLQPACRRCNQSRGAMNADDFRAKLKAQQHIDATRRPGNTTSAISRAMRAAQRPAPGAARPTSTAGHSTPGAPTGAGRPQPGNGESAGIRKPVTTREWYKRTAD